MATNKSLFSKFYQQLFLIIVAINLLLGSCKIIETYWQYDLGVDKAMTHGKVYYSTDAMSWHELIPEQDTLVFSHIKFYFKAVSDSGYALIDWSHPKMIGSLNPNITQAVNITENTYLCPAFGKITNYYTVKASSAMSNGKIRYSVDSNIWYDLDQNGTPSIASGEKIWLAAIPVQGYFWQQWTDDASGTKDSIHIVVNKNLIVGASFTNINPKKWTITINPIPTNGNKIQYTTGVSTNPYMDIPSNPFELNEGTILFLKAIPNDGSTPNTYRYNFASWTGDASGTMPIANPITINKDITISAIFNLHKYILTLPTIAEGSLTYSTDNTTWKSATAPLDTVQIRAGTMIYVKVQPIVGKLLKNIQVNGTNVSPDSLNIATGTVTIMMNSDKIITPIFNTTYALTLQPKNGETIKAYWKNTYNTADEISIADLKKILANTTVYIKVTPPNTKILESIKTNGSTSDNLNLNQGTATVTMNSDKIVTAIIKLTYKLTLKSELATTNGKPIPNITAYSDVNRTIPIPDLNNILPNTIVYLKTTPGDDPVLQTMKTNGSNSDNFAPYQGTSTVTMNSDKTVVATFEALSQFTFSGNTITGYKGSLREIVLPGVSNTGAAVKVIGEESFRQRNFISLFMPNGINSIERLAFSGSHIANPLNIPNGVTRISDWAFSGCWDLPEIILPATINSIGLGAFNGCNKLLNVTILATSPPNLGENVFSYTPVAGLVIHVPSGSVSTYKNTEPYWKLLAGHITN